MNTSTATAGKASKTRGSKPDVYQTITNQIIAAIEAGAGTFIMPWHRDVDGMMPTNYVTGNVYNGVNVISLWIAAEQRGFTSANWATYKQWNSIGCQVRKGEKGSVIVFYKQVDLEFNDSGTGVLENKSVLFARSSRVFNVDQIDGLQIPDPEARDFAGVLIETEEFVGATCADIWNHGDRACYRSNVDLIQMPARHRFTGTETISATESYYATLLHELIHWTGHEIRLDRDLSGRFGRESYALEELIAELGAAFLCSYLGISNQPRPDHAAYIANWLIVLKNDTRAIFTAASKANAAMNYLLGLQLAR